MYRMILILSGQKKKIVVKIKRLKRTPGLAFDGAQQHTFHSSDRWEGEEQGRWEVTER